MIINPRCPEAAPRRGGQASASARTGDFILLIFLWRCTKKWMLTL
nr:MAG TPA: hypothetical protein [Bacteriophage sp.]